MSKVAMITGSSKGIGKSIAQRLAKDGFKIVVNYFSSRKQAWDVVDEIKASGGVAMLARADVSSAVEVSEMFDLAEKEYGKVDVLVNNAGIIVLKAIGDFDDESFSRIFDINVRGTFNTLRCAANRLNHGGAVINISSSAIGLAMPGYGIYNASKAAVEAMSYTFAKELRGKNITVNTIAPGPTATDLFLNGKTQEQIEHFLKIPPLERLGTPTDIANVVSFLAGAGGAWVNGQNIKVNGGII